MKVNVPDCDVVYPGYDESMLKKIMQILLTKATWAKTYTWCRRIHCPTQSVC